MLAASVKIIKILEKYISIAQKLYMKPEQKIKWPLLPLTHSHLMRKSSCVKTKSKTNL